LLWTQERLADTAGVSCRAISDIERGVHTKARLSTLARLADALLLTDVERGQLLSYGADPASPGDASNPSPERHASAPELAAKIGAWEVAVTENERHIQELSSHAAANEADLCRAFLALGRSATLALRRHDARPAFVRAGQLALTLNDRESLVAAAAGYGFMTKVGDPGADADETWRSGLRALADDDLSGRSTLSAARATSLRLAGREAAGREVATYALGLARRSGSADALAVAISAYVMATWGTPNVRERRELADELASLECVALDHVELSGIELSAYPRLESGDATGFAACAEHLRRAGAVVAHPYAVAQAEMWDATTALLRGDYGEAEHRSASAVSLAGHAPNFTNGHLAQVFSIRLAQGRADELLPGLRRLVREQPEELAWRAAWTNVASTQAESREPVMASLERIRHEFWPLEHTWTFPVAAAFLLDAACNVGDLDLVERLEEQLRPYAGTFLVVSTATACEGAVEHYLGRAAITLGHRDRGVALLQSACERHGRLGSPHLVERTERALRAAA
jgi:hypothetical protein